jgi:hypothetical protein
LNIILDTSLDWRSILFLRPNCLFSIDTHLPTAPQVPRDEEGEPLYEDFICRACSTTFSFLGFYPQSIWAAGRQCDAIVDTNKDKNVSEDTSSASGSGKLENDVDAHNNPIKEHAKTYAVSVSDGDGSSLGENSQKNEGSNQHIKGCLSIYNLCSWSKPGGCFSCFRE